jgi:hypothetical protein
MAMNPSRKQVVIPKSFSIRPNRPTSKAAGAVEVVQFDEIKGKSLRRPSTTPPGEKDDETEHCHGSGGYNPIGNLGVRHFEFFESSFHALDSTRPRSGLQASLAVAAKSVQ